MDDNPIASTPPKEVRSRLEKVNGTFAVKNEVTNEYEYYPIRLSKVPRGTNGKFIDFVKMPPFIAEGYVTYKRNVYFVSMREILRRYVNVSRDPVNLTAINGNANTTSSIDIPSIELEEANSVDDKSRISGDIELIYNQAIDLAWKEQISTLQYLDDC